MKFISYKRILKLNSIYSALKPIQIFSYIFPIFPYTLNTNKNISKLTINLNFVAFIWQICVFLFILWFGVLKLSFFGTIGDWTKKNKISAFDYGINIVYYFQLSIKLFIPIFFFHIFQKRFIKLMICLEKINEKFKKLKLRQEHTNKEVFICSLLFLTYFIFTQSLGVYLDIYRFTSWKIIKFSYHLLNDCITALFSFVYVLLFDIKTKLKLINKHQEVNEKFLQRIVELHKNFYNYGEKLNHIFNPVFALILLFSFVEIVMNNYYFIINYVRNIFDFDDDTIIYFVSINLDNMSRIFLLVFVVDEIYAQVFICFENY